jgi:hypothetical protein
VAKKRLEITVKAWAAHPVLKIVALIAAQEMLNSLV